MGPKGPLADGTNYQSFDGQNDVLLQSLKEPRLVRLAAWHRREDRPTEYYAGPAVSS